METLDQLATRLKSTRTNTSGLTILITGATSGIGIYAAKLLARINPLNRIILVGRTQAKADIARNEVITVLPKDEGHEENVIALACDHCSLNSVKPFEAELRAKLKETYRVEKWAMNGIDVLCLNAAVLVPQGSEPEFTVDNLEVTFQTNYLTPFLVGNCVLDLLNPGGRVVVATSGLHVGQTLNFDGMIDDESGSAKKEFSMIDDSEFHFKQCYTLSKVCNVAYCLELNRILQPRGIVANCFSPGLMTTSGLFRHQCYSGDSGTFVQNKHVLMKEKTVEWGAGALVFMVLADMSGRRGGEFWRDSNSTKGAKAIYGKEFCPCAISEESISQEKRTQLWRLSCELAGIPCDHNQIEY